MRSSRRVTVTLGDQLERVEARVRSGDYSSISEVVRAGLCALEREEAALNDMLRRKVERSLADPRPSIPAEEVFADVAAEVADDPLHTFTEWNSEADRKGYADL